jgi:uncharacterized caspase-like protein
MNRALLVGINAYPGAPLSGCVNDVSDMAHFLVDRCGFQSRDVRLLVDARATKTAIMERLQWLVRDVKAGDRLLFHYSGHGAQVATRDPHSGEVDGLDEVICPVDFDWTDPHLIRDKEFRQMFSSVPAGVEFVWVSDSCHSADLSRDLAPPPNLHVARPKRLPPPVDMHWRIKTALERGIKPRQLAATAVELNVALISGCRSDQTSADAYFNDRANGALTYYLLRALEAPHGLRESLSELVPSVRSALHRAGYAQRPQLEGAQTLRDRGFLSATTG